MGCGNGIPNPMHEVQHVRLVDTNQTTGVNSPTRSPNEGECIVLKKTPNKEQDQVGKTNRFCKIG